MSIHQVEKGGLYKVGKIVFQSASSSLWKGQDCNGLSKKRIYFNRTPRGNCCHRPFNGDIDAGITDGTRTGEENKLLE